MYYVYLLLLKNGNIYTGSSADLKGRIAAHMAGKVLSTRNYRPIQLVHYEAYLLKEDAIRRENFLKTSDGKRFLKQQLSVFFKKIRPVTHPPLIERP